MPVNISHLVFIEAVVCCALAFAWFCLSRAAKQELGYAPAVVAIVLPACAFLLPSLTLMHVVMLLIVPVLARGSAGRIAPIYLIALMMLPGLPVNIMTGSLRWWMHDLHITLAIGALIALLASPDRARGRLVHDLPFLCIIALYVCATSRSTSITHFLREATQYGLAYAIPYFVVSRSVRSQEDIKRIMLGLMWGAIIVSAILLFEAWRTWPLYRFLYWQFGLDAPTGGDIKLRAGMLRASGPFLESTSAAFQLVFCFFAAFLLREKFKSRMHYVLCMGFLGAGLLPPQSRGAWLALLIGFLLIELFRKRYAKVARNVALLAGGLALVGSVALVSDRVSQMAGLSGGAADTVDYRERLWERGTEEVWKYPLIGRPLPQVLAALNDLVQGENIVDFVNTYLFFALVAGVPGALIFAASLAGAAYSVVKARSRLGPTPALTFVFLGAMLPLEMLAFTSFAGRGAILVYSIMGLAAALQRLRKTEPRQRSARRQTGLHHQGDGHLPGFSDKPPRSYGPRSYAHSPPGSS